MSNDKITVCVGSSLAEDLAGVADAWERAAAGEAVQHHVLSFESWEALSSVLTPERLRMLRLIRQMREMRSIRELSRHLERNYRNVHDDVVALERAGLIVRTHHSLRATADKVTVEV
jgi:predicted transcriptional regulator